MAAVRKSGVESDMQWAGLNQVVWQNVANSQAGDYIVERSRSPTFASAVSTVAGTPTALCAGCSDLTLTAPADADPTNYNFRVRYNPGGTGDVAVSAIVSQPASLNCELSLSMPWKEGRIRSHTSP